MSSWSRSLGADRVIDYTAEDFTKDARTYDVVLDAVGKTSFGRCKRLLKPRGIFLSSDLGPLSQNPLLALVTPLFGRRKVMFPIPRKHDRAASGVLPRDARVRDRSGRSSTDAIHWSRSSRRISTSSRDRRSATS